MLASVYLGVYTFPEVRELRLSLKMWPRTARMPWQLPSEAKIGVEMECFWELGAV